MSRLRVEDLPPAMRQQVAAAGNAPARRTRPSRTLPPLESGTWTCCQCDTQFPSDTRAEKHVLQVHQGGRYEQTIRRTQP